MTNRDLAEKIYEDLNKKGAELGNASIGIIRKTLDNSIPDVSGSLPVYDVDFGGHCKASIKIENGTPVIIGAMNGWGDGIDGREIKIVKRQ